MDMTLLNKIELIKICGHYTFSEDRFIQLIRKFASVSKLSMSEISKKLQSISKITSYQLAIFNNVYLTEY